MIQQEPATVQEMKAAVLRAVDARADEIVGIAREIESHPELGFKEFRTSRLVADRFARLGLAYQDGLGVTGVRAVIEGGAGPGPTVAVLGELDSVLCWEHPRHDPETGAVHACGHHTQVAAMLGVGMGLLDSGVLANLHGRVVLMAVPAEEYVEIEERLRMRAEGKLEFLAGKPEMLRVGAFDDVDMAMMVHATTNPAEGPLGIGGTTNGMVAKFIRYLGYTTHASSPHDAINALYAAEVALVGINALRETFRDEDHVRVHPIITRGGDLVSAIPADVRVETFVRAASADALARANGQVNRALKAGALALGAGMEMTTTAGYLPLQQDATLQAIYQPNAERLVGVENLKRVGHRAGGTDMGDLGHVMPVLHPFAGGSTGVIHGADFQVVDPNVAVVHPARAMAMTIVDLLADGAAKGREVVDNYRPKFTREQYLSFVRDLASVETYDGASE